MIKVVWINGGIISEIPLKGTGTWTLPLAKGLIESGKVELYNISHWYGRTKECNTVYGIKQILIPQYKRGDNLLNKYEPKRFRDIIEKILNEIKPDLVHIWGTETKLCTLQTCGNIKYPCLIDIQGLFSSYYQYYYGDLTPREVLTSFFSIQTLLLKKTSPYHFKMIYKKRGNLEIDVLNSYKHISVQSNWVKEQICAFVDTNKTTIHETGIALRREFLNSKQWEPHEHTEPIIYTSGASANLPYKGLYTLLKALLIIKGTYPNVVLKLPGSNPLQTKLLSRNGYHNIIIRYIKKNQLEKNIMFLGQLEAKQIVEELRNADIGVIPSYVETYCLAAAESMTVGLPTVISNSSALVELAKDGEEALFYNPMDYKSLAYKIIYLFRNKQKSKILSKNGRIKHLMENNINKIVEKQIHIYNEIINK